MGKITITLREDHLPEGIVLAGKCRILRTLRMGEFSVTYEAMLGNRKVAVKEFYNRGCMYRQGNRVVLTNEEDQQEFEKAKQKFVEEARRLSKFASQPNVVRVYGYFEANNTVYIIMEFLDGPGLNEYFRKKGRVEAAEMFGMLLPVMRTLDKIHKSGIIHRDISPDNIKFAQNDASGTGLKLMDFGSARDYLNRNTYTMELKDGSAPLEQYSEHEQGPWTDVYALSAVIYRGITGQRPMRSVRRAEHDDLRMPSQLGIPIPPVIEEILKRGLSIRKENRYQKMASMIKDVEKFSGGM